MFWLARWSTSSPGLLLVGVAMLALYYFAHFCIGAAVAYLFVRDL